MSSKTTKTLDTTIVTKASLLYVDTIDSNYKKNTEIFDRLFKNTFYANNFEDAIDAYNQNDTMLSIVLINIDDTGINGLEFIKHIRHRDNDLPIFIISDFENPKNLLSALKFNISDYIAKPILMNTTVRIIIELLNEIESEKKIRKQQSELSQFKEILDRQNLVSETDLKGNILYANEIFCEVSGYTLEELKGKPHNIVRHPDSPSSLFKQMWDTIQKGEIWQGKMKNKAKDGSAYYVKAMVVPMFDGDGNIVKYISSRFLITDDEKQKQLLKKQLISEKTRKFSKYKESQTLIDKALAEQEAFYKLEIVKFEETIHDINEERKSLKRKNNAKEDKIKELEEQIRYLQAEKNKILQDHRNSYQVQYDQAKKLEYENMTIRNSTDKLNEKLDVAQNTIRDQQLEVDGLKKRIDDLMDVIKHG